MAKYTINAGVINNASPNGPVIDIAPYGADAVVRWRATRQDGTVAYGGGTSLDVIGGADPAHVDFIRSSLADGASFVSDSDAPYVQVRGTVDAADGDIEIVGIVDFTSESAARRQGSFVSITGDASNVIARDFDLSDWGGTVIVGVTGPNGGLFQGGTVLALVNQDSDSAPIDIVNPIVSGTRNAVFTARTVRIDGALPLGNTIEVSLFGLRPDARSRPLDFVRG